MVGSSCLAVYLLNYTWDLPHGPQNLLRGGAQKNLDLCDPAPQLPNGESRFFPSVFPRLLHLLLGLPERVPRVH